jgi:hypothetical protein
MVVISNGRCTLGRRLFGDILDVVHVSGMICALIDVRLLADKDKNCLVKGFLGNEAKTFGNP